MISELMSQGLKREFGASSSIHVFQGFSQLTEHKIRSSAGLDDNMRKHGLSGSIKLVSYAF